MNYGAISKKRFSANTPINWVEVTINDYELVTGFVPDDDCWEVTPEVLEWLVSYAGEQWCWCYKIERFLILYTSIVSFRFKDNEIATLFKLSWG